MLNLEKYINIVNIIGTGGPEIYSNNVVKYINKNKYFNIINAEIPQRNIMGNFKSVNYIRKTFSFIKFVNQNYKRGLLHLPSQELGRYTQLLNYEKLLLTVHDIIPSELCQPTSKTSKFCYDLDMDGIERADHIITISEYTKNDLIRKRNIPNKKISVIYYGIDHDIFYPRKEKSNTITDFSLDKPYILYVGSEQPRKNIKVLIESFHIIKKISENKNLKLVIVGKQGIYRENTVKQIIKLGLLKEVIFLDYLPQNKLPELYSFSKVFVFPSLYEGFGFPPLEAMCCGTPVITSNASSIPEVVGDAGILLDPSDVYGFAEAIKTVLENEEQRQKIIEKGLNRAKIFNWEIAANKTLDIYAKCLES